MSVTRKAKALARQKNILEKRSMVEKSKIDEEDEYRNLDQELSGEEIDPEDQTRTHEWNESNPDETTMVSITTKERTLHICEVSLKSRTPGARPCVTVDEMKEAEKLWWKKIQSDSFSSEIHSLQKGKPLDRESRLRQLSPFLDEEGFLRVKGRIDAALDLPVETKRPIILDTKHSYTKLLIDHCHREGAHQGQARVMNDLRQKFWILDIRTAVRASWTRCQECKNKRAQPIIPEMGALPSSRVTSRRLPFSQTGVDYFGPMEVTIGRSRVKRWGVLFSCMATRAIHLEVSPTLETDQMIMALTRFISLRGRPEDIHSDNGTNFVGADAELRRCLEEMNQDTLTTTMATNGIRWHFIPPAAPHMGGSWERLVQMVKKHLRTLLKEKAPKEFTLLTLLAEVENMVNSRPLTEVSNDPADLEALTPNHFLRMGTDVGPTIPGKYEDRDMFLRKEWRKAQRMADQFWERWVREYLPTLIRREKWHDTAKPIMVDDVVIVVDDQLPRNNWTKGIITGTFPGKDGIVRAVDVKTTTGTFRRPVAKICRLDVHREDKDPSSDLMGGRMSAPARKGEN
jgi:transposase InsO family protein